ncbi:unnamed protein product (macronuclear) [Paramecium tetraurelia]|uniref:Mini antigen n=1 Tax=Paramecium tetraurelia TaxID=5888 RepID=A0BPT2_PARTE|nr:uncharacterized protein GSPATT00005299001 [Paramecium tetraurelia]CAK60549.1 unnamed protein product [Paramecium tetraurelia]|eukprot:XP_001427947.1 hypothetical protein (macronuclear) [Paramecium tetraurelia strain d4-2]
MAFIFNTTAININQKKKCDCISYLNDFECNLNQQCMWINSACQTKTCSQFYYPFQCKSSQGCFYNPKDNTCGVYAECSQLTATSQQDCESQSYYCGLYNTTSKVCQSLPLNACPQYTVQQECLYSGQGQLCLWSDNQCQDFNCSLINTQSQCQTYNLYCTWMINTQQCVTATCDNKAPSECTLFLSKNGNNTDIQPCYVDYSATPAKCRDASLSDLSAYTCSLNTLNYALWNNGNLHSGSCELCYAPLIQIIILAILIMIQ